MAPKEGFVRGMTFLLVLVPLGCEVTVRPERGPLELVPADAHLIVTLEWPTLRRYPELRRGLSIEDLENQWKVLGLRTNEVQQVVIFAGEDEEAEGEAFIITGPLRGPVRRGRSERYGRYNLIYVEPADRWGVHLRSGPWVFGSLQAVQNVIDVERNPEWGLARRHPFDGVLRQLALGRRPVAVFWRIPESQRDVTQALWGLGAAFLKPLLGPLAYWVEDIDIAQGFGLSVVPGQGRWMMELLVLASDEESAGQIAGTLGLLRGLGALIPEQAVTESERPYVEALRSLTVRRDGALLTLTWPFPVE